MPSYRVEQASTGRASCQNKECKDNKVKIAKGELRHGSWVDSGQYQSWSWRHWGCVTPKVIGNINNLIGEGDDRDLDMLDGYEDLPSDLQKKIQKALEQGHVDDEDWKGDVEMNRPGQNGFRVKSPKKKAKDADKEEKDDADEEEEKRPKSSKTKKRGRFQEDEDGKEAETDQPKRPKRKPTGYPKKAPIASDEDDDDDDSESPEPEPKPKASKRGRPAKASKPAATSGKRGRKAKDTE
ncbi:uncharacterized protein BDV17DRAFT_257230 [Aspergillus undulatus]|uniref:uncharacterized protein n=1 Tax=Aspergillus undulatus TaxID=1810928 RepID=UPI003CCD7ACB